jgi:hypothetical protein
MTKKRLVLLLSTIGCTSLLSGASLDCLFPAGGQADTTLDVSVRGYGLQAISGALVSGDGVETAVTAVLPYRPVPGTANQRLPQLQDEVRLRVSIAPDALPGPRDFRLVSSNDISEPLTFWVGSHPEIVETEPNDAAAHPAVLAALPVCINGRIAARGEDDGFRFHAVQGHTLVARAQARALIPALEDTRPGWFQPQLAVFDAAGRTLAQTNSFRAGPDPLLVFTAPATGDYTLRLRDAFGRGREDFVYRLTLGELPLVTGFFPMGCRKGDPANVSLEGVNLPPQKIRIFSGNKTPETCLRALTDDRLAYDALRFDLDVAPECLEEEPNNDERTAQHVSPPLIVNGTLDRPGDQDVFSLDGRAGQTLAVDVRALRLGSPLAATVSLVHNGTVLVARSAAAPAFEAPAADSGDPSLIVRLPSDGRYELRVGSADGTGGADSHYRLFIGPPRPAFDLWVNPATLSIPLGGAARTTVYVHRSGGFEGPVALGLDNPPVGIACAEVRIPANATEGTLVIAATSSTKKLPHAPFELNLSGTATNGTEVLQAIAIPAHRVPDARGFVPVQTWMASVGAEKRTVALHILLPPSATHIQAPRTGAFDVTIATGRPKFTADLVAVAVVAPAGGFDVEHVRNGDHPGELRVSLRTADGGNAPAAVGDLVLSVGRNVSRKTLIKRPPAAALTPPTPYVLE